MTEVKTVHKWFWAWEFEKEDAWLNGMAMSGWVLESVGFSTYQFRACEPGSYTVRLECCPRDEGSITFMEETGAEFIGRVAQWAYFRKKTVWGEFQIFSDLDSKLSHLDRIGKILFAGGMANLAIGLANSVNPAVELGWLNLLCATGLMYGLGRIHGMKESLEQRRKLGEY